MVNFENIKFHLETSLNALKAFWYGMIVFFLWLYFSIYAFAARKDINFEDTIAGHFVERMDYYRRLTLFRALLVQASKSLNEKFERK